MTTIEEIEGFDWENATMRTIGSLCCKCQTKEEAKKVLEDYRKINPEYADANLGYMFGYYDVETRKKLYSLFETCNHPVFGQGFGRGNEPSPGEAFEKGNKFNGTRRKE